MSPTAWYGLGADQITGVYIHRIKVQVGKIGLSSP